MIKNLRYPFTEKGDIDSPVQAEHHRSLIRNKPFLHKIYQKWYSQIVSSLPPVPGNVLELGSGGGFLSNYVPQAIRSDVLHLQSLDLVCAAQKLPFKGNSLKAVIMINVLHHIPSVEDFFREASRCLKSKGRIIVVEPWMSCMGRLVYKYLHHEACLPEAHNWSFSAQGPLSGANAALPWIVFDRDQDLFAQLFPQLHLCQVTTEVNFRYLLSGGLSYRSILPGWAYPGVEFIENILPEQIQGLVSLFACIQIEKM